MRRRDQKEAEEERSACNSNPLSFLHATAPTARGFCPNLGIHLNLPNQLRTPVVAYAARYLTEYQSQ